MPVTLPKLTLCLALTGVVALAPARVSFEVATIKPAAPLDQAKILADLQSGGKLPAGATIGSQRAEYLYLDLKALLTYACGVKPYQITGPDWMARTRFRYRGEDAGWINQRRRAQDAATLEGLADMLTQLTTEFSGGTEVRRIVDMTGIKGN